MNTSSDHNQTCNCITDAHKEGSKNMSQTISLQSLGDHRFSKTYTVRSFSRGLLPKYPDSCRFLNSTEYVYEQFFLVDTCNAYHNDPANE